MSLFLFQGADAPTSLGDVQIVVVPDDQSGVCQAQEVTLEVASGSGYAFQDLNAVSFEAESQATVNRNEKSSRFFQTLSFCFFVNVFAWNSYITDT